MLTDRFKYLLTGALTLLIMAAWVPSAFSAFNAATGGIGGLNNGTLSGGDGTGTARIELFTADGVVDPDNSSVTVNPSTVPADGVNVSTVTVILMDSDNQPIQGRTVNISTDRGGVVDIITQPLAPTDATGTTTGTIQSSVPGVSTVSATDTLDSVVLNDHPQILFTQGIVLDLAKSANKREEVVGGVVTYLVEIRNLTGQDVGQVSIEDLIPPNFKFIRGSARLDGAVLPDPVGIRPTVFDIGTVPAFVDSNGNGRADAGEQGYRALSYQLAIGSGAGPGEYTNTAMAWDAGPLTPISNTSQARVRVTLDPLFDLGTIIGKVFDDENRDGLQDRGERGIPGAVVVLDNGTIVTTDVYGRYHIPAVRPGHRLVKLDKNSLAAGAEIIGDPARIVSVTPGLLVKVNYGVVQEMEARSIGRPAVPGLIVASREEMEPVEVYGSVEMRQVIVNGVNANLPRGDVKLAVHEETDAVNITGARLEGPISFYVSAWPVENVSLWKLTILDSDNEEIKVLTGDGPVPEVIQWNGITDQGDLIGGGRIYRYSMEITYLDGRHSTSALRTFGVNQKSFVALDISGSGFALGSAALRPATRELLAEVAVTLRDHPDEVVVIEGHTDSEGSEELNLRLSRKRAEAARNYLVEDQGLAPDRFVLKYYGESMPVASNRLPEGRRINRRVEIKGQLLEVNMSQLLDQYRTEPTVLIDGIPVQISEDGRFKATVRDVGADGMRIDLVSATGAVTVGRLPVPDLQIMEPSGVQRIGLGQVDDRYSAGDPGADGLPVTDGHTVMIRLRGRTGPGNTVELGNQLLSVDDEGYFDAELDLVEGEENIFSLLVQNTRGFIRIARLRVEVSGTEEDGELVIIRDPVPNLTVRLPRQGVDLHNPHLVITGSTDPGNRVRINDRTVDVRTDGAFAAELDLVEGENALRFEAIDRRGYSGVIERTVTLSKDRMFFMAFADGKIGQLQGKGHLEGAGMKKDREFYQEGRAAYYLKGTVAGKYLITSAFDSGTGEFGDLFTDLDEGDRDRFFTNLDPDKYYPVYGDSSETTYDAQSQGKFYLAVDSDEFHLLVGNYSLNLSDTELAAYQRTLYGVNFEYRSLARSKHGEHDLTVALFGAQARYTHVRDELRGTGGSLYYLSRRDVTEGSEQVAIIIRDKITGLMLAEIPQRRNVDYQVRYEEGRLLFNRPISSVVADDTLIDNALLSGDFVSVQVDYEVRADDLERTSVGGRVQKQLGDNLSIGGTYVADELESGSYDLSGVDAKVRLSDNSWVSAEIARSSGSDSPVYVSDDGGLTFTEVASSSDTAGEAFKAAAELDVGELFGAPERLKVGTYIKRLNPGFASGANHTEEGVQKYGADFSLVVSGKDTIRGRFDELEHLDPASLAPGAEDESRSGILQWTHKRDRIGLTLEYQTSESEDNTGALITRSGIAAGRLDILHSENLSSYLEHQATMSGPGNDQTSAGVQYQATQALSLGATGTHGTKGSALTGEANLNIGDSRLYATERMTDDNAGHSSATVLGAETAVDGSTKVYTENQWERADGGQSRQVSLVGARRNWDLAPGLTGVLSAEASEANSGSGKSSRYAVSTALSYTNPEGLEASVSGELRREKGTRETVQYLTANRLKLMLSPDYSLLGRYNYSITRDLDLDEVEARFEERSIGLAYRPVKSDRLNLLSKYTELSDLAPENLDGVTSSDTLTQVFSVEWSYDITPRLEWVEKEALKTTEEKTGDWEPVKSTTALSIHRLNYNFVSAWDLGVEYRLRTVDVTDDQQTGWLMELMYGLGEHFRIGFGYNFTDFSDNEFSDNDYSTRGTFLRFQGKY